MIIGAERVLAAGRDVAPGHVVIEDGRIARIGEGIPARCDYALAGGSIVPGFIDLQVNGGAGVDLLDCGGDDVMRLSAYLASTGTTGFLPTLITAPLDRLRAAVDTVAEARPQGAQILGVHLEGPVINPAHCGAHEVRWVRNAGDPAVRELYTDVLPHLRLVTLAPEVGADALIDWLVRERVTVSLGHTDATYEQAAAAFERGARMVTHLFNAMRGLHHRDPGVVGAALAHPACICGLIADGTHVHPISVRLAYRLLGPDRIALVTDAVAAAGLPPGTYTLGGRDVQLGADGSVRLGDGTLAGSAVRMDAAVANVAGWGVSLRDAVRSASTTPAMLLGLADRGVLREGLRADLAVLGGDGRAILTVVAGQVVHDALS